MLIEALVEDERAECIDVFVACARESATVRVTQCGEVLLPVRLLRKEQRLLETGGSGVRIHIPGGWAKPSSLILVDVVGAIPLRAICRRSSLSHSLSRAYTLRTCIACPLVDVYTDADLVRGLLPLPSLTVPGSFILERVEDGSIAVFHRPMTFAHKRSGHQRIVVVLSDGTVVKETVGVGLVVATSVPLMHAVAVFQEDRDVVRENISIGMSRDGRCSLVSKLPLIVGGC